MPLFSIINLAFGIYDDMLLSPLLNVEKIKRKYFYPLDLHTHKNEVSAGLLQS